MHLSILILCVVQIFAVAVFDDPKYDQIIRLFEASKEYGGVGPKIMSRRDNYLAQKSYQKQFPSELAPDTCLYCRDIIKHNEQRGTQPCTKDIARLFHKSCLEFYTQHISHKCPLDGIF